MKQEHITVLQEFVTHQKLLDVHSYTGYNGGVVLRLRTSDRHLLEDVHEFCMANNIEVTSKYNHNLGTNEIFIIAPDDVYELRRKS